MTSCEERDSVYICVSLLGIQCENHNDCKDVHESSLTFCDPRTRVCTPFIGVGEACDFNTQCGEYSEIK